MEGQGSSPAPLLTLGEFGSHNFRAIWLVFPILGAMLGQFWLVFRDLGAQFCGSLAASSPFWGGGGGKGGERHEETPHGKQFPTDHLRNGFQRVSKNGFQRAILVRFCFSVRFAPLPPSFGSAQYRPSTDKLEIKRDP